MQSVNDLSIPHKEYEYHCLIPNYYIEEISPTLLCPLVSLWLKGY